MANKEKRIVITNKCIDKFTYGIDDLGYSQLLKHSSELTEVIKTRGKGISPLEVKGNRENLDVIEYGEPL